jgi:hypothetical protein
LSPPILALLALLGATPTAATSAQPAFCGAIGPEYYAIELFTTRNIPGTGLAKGMVDVTVASSSPFSVQLDANGRYQYNLGVTIRRMRAPRYGHLVAWVTTPDLDEISRLGTLDQNFQASGSVAWNQFIVVITLEEADDPEVPMWSGPVVFRGLSRSGMMHTMAGHGALQQENCAAYGYGN